MNRISIKAYLVFSSNFFLDKIFFKIRKPFLFNLISKKNINEALDFPLRNQELLL